MEHFVTIFDSVFLPQGMALHASMERHLDHYTLWFLCVDDVAYELLTQLNLANTKLLQLSKLETEELCRVKKSRTSGEYCWTLTPFAPKFVFNADSNIQRVTYIDADIWFTSNPWPIFHEFETSNKAVLITKHSFAPEYDSSVMNGKYCVQFIIYNRNSSSEILDWWCDRCIDWCYGFYEDGKFGDQLYLNSWELLFKNKVHILSRQGYAMAPWNAKIFAYSDSIFYHFQGLRILENSEVLLCAALSIPRNVINNLYKPYLKDLRSSINLLKELGFTISPQSKKPSFSKRLRGIAKELISKISMIGHYRITKL